MKMTETEARTRLAEGRLYDPGQEGILEEQRRRMEILYDYNATRPSETGRRAELLGKMLAEAGENCYIEPPFHANWGGKHVHLSDYVYANFGLTSFGFDHNFDHNAIKKVWRTIQRNALNKN